MNLFEILLKTISNFLCFDKLQVTYTTNKNYGKSKFRLYKELVCEKDED